MNYRERYFEAHKAWFKVKYPTAWKDGYWTPPKMPSMSKANGLTRFVLNFIEWSGYRATRISSAGRMVDGRYIPGTTRKGTADISATIRGKSVMIEIKVGRDKPSPYQLAEQQKERAAGGIYEFVSGPDEFFSLYDSLL